MGRPLLLAATFVLAASFVGPADASVIDLFEDGDFELTVAPGDSDSVSQSMLSGVIDGHRRVEVENLGLAGPGNVATVSLTTTPGPDALDADLAGSAAVGLGLTYGEMDDLNADFTGDTHMSLSFDRLPGLGMSGIWSITLELTSGMISASDQASSFTATGTNVSFDYSDPAFAAVDFSDIDRIDIGMTTDFGLDFALAEIHSVPEPGAWMILAGLGAPLLLRRRRRRA